MNLKGYAAALRRRGFRARRTPPSIALGVTAALLGGLCSAAVLAAPAAQAAASAPIWSTQLDFDNNGAAWSESFFAGLASDGLTTAELDMPWGTIEPSAGTFTFTEFDQELANAAGAGIKLVPIFWQAGWGGSPASWINDFEEGSGGAQGSAPDWWNPTEQSEYFTYVENTIKNAVAQPGGYGGSILDYGYLDAMWDLNGAGGGYTADDVSEFQNTYLPQTYGTIATFNSDNGTSYSAFTQVPAAAPGAALFGVFQAFRAWSVQQTYGTLTADVRAFTATPLFYYFGGGFGNATNYANNPDTFFELAKTYNVTIIDDDASSQGLTLTFASLARAYGVQLMQEWTAPPSDSQLSAEAVQWLSLYGLGLPNGGGEDFFIHDGTTKDTVGFPIYTAWLPTLKTLSGTYPQQSTAVYIDFSQAYGNTNGGSLNTVENQLASLWLDYQAGFTVVTSQEVANGAVSLSQFKAVLPLNGVDANLTSYKSGGGTLLTSEAQLTSYITPYAQIDSQGLGVLQTVPDVAASGTSASITLGNITSGTTYNYPVAFSPSGLGLASGTYYLVNAATGAAVPQTRQSSGLVCASANIGPATLAQWTMVAGTAPAGTASSSCPVTGIGATTVTATAGQANGGLTFQGIGQTNAGSDGNLTQITQGGETAEETWTSAQSGAGDANVYLQLNPLSAVEAASTVTTQVTYWATAGQGFTVQYDTPTNAYQNGPVVSSPGTGTWTTATVQLTGAQFSEAENGGADLRLNVANSSVPLIVQSITMSVTNSSSPLLSASPTSVAFGNQNVGTTSGTKSVTISNSGNASATVSGVSVSGNFSQTNNCSTIAAGGSCTVNVAFSPSAGGAANGTLTVTSNASNSPTTVALSGTGVSSSTNLALGATMTASSTYSGFPATNANDGNTSSYWESQDGAAYPQTLTANLGSAQSLGSVTLDLPPSSAWATRTETLSVLGSTNGSSWTTLVGSAGYTFNPSTGNTVSVNLPSGTSEQYLQLSFTGNTGWTAAQVSEFEIFPGSGGGTGSATLSASPTSVAFGNQTDGTTSSAHTVTISNTGTAAATISSVSAASPFAETNTCGTSLAAGASCTASVTFAPSSAGTASGTLTVASNATNSTLAVALTGTGVAPTSATLSASPTSVAFGNQTVGTTSAVKTVTVSNTGTAAATISSITAGSGFAETNTCGSSLAAGASCTVSVTFSPTSATAYSASLTVLSNATNGTLSVALTGTGTATPTATLTASPTSVNLGSETVGSTSAAQTVTITNTGSATATISSVGTASPFAETTTCGSTLAAGASCTVSVAFKPTATGVASGTLTVASNATDSTLTVALSGTGTSTSGTPVNLALNQPIVASSSASGYPASNANDGNTSGYWEGASGAWPTTLAVNLGASDALSYVTVDLPPAMAWSTRTQTLSVLGSTNDSTWTTLVSSATYTFNPSTGNTVSINLPAGTTDQYVELSFTANNVQNAAQVSEFQVWGTSSGTALPNLALNAPITASSSTQTYVASNANDGNTSTYWEGTNGAWPTTLAVNLGSSQTLGSVVVDLPPSSSWGTRTQTLSVLGSTNGSTYTTLVGSATYTFNPSTGNTVTIALPAGATDQYVELSFTANSVQNGAQVSEFQIFG